MFKKLERGEAVRVGKEWLRLGPTPRQMAIRFGLRVVVFIAIAVVLDVLAPMIGWSKKYAPIVAIIAAIGFTYWMFGR